MEIESMDKKERTVIVKDNNVNEIFDKDVSFRFVLYQRESFFQTERVIKRGPWCPSISLSKQSGEIAKKEHERNGQPTESKSFYCHESVVNLLNHFEYHYITESSLTNRSATQRGLNGTDIADLRLDVENIIFNETVRYLVILVMRQDGINALFKMESKPDLVSKAFQLTFQALDKAEIFKLIKDELMKNVNCKKDVKAVKYFNNNVKEFVSWFGYRSTFFSLTSHIQKVLYKER